jgi:hypothetical protein
MGLEQKRQGNVKQCGVRSSSDHEASQWGLYNYDISAPKNQIFSIECIRLVIHLWLLDIQGFSPVDKLGDKCPQTKQMNRNICTARKGCKVKRKMGWWNNAHV